MTPFGFINALLSYTAILIDPTQSIWIFECTPTERSVWLSRKMLNIFLHTQYPKRVLVYPKRNSARTTQTSRFRVHCSWLLVN